MTVPRNMKIIPVHGAGRFLLTRDLTTRSYGTHKLWEGFSTYRTQNISMWPYRMLIYCFTRNEMKWIGLWPLLGTYRFNWARRTWWDEWDDTSLQTQESKFKPWRSEAEHATSRSPRLPKILSFTSGWGRNIFVSFKPGNGPRTPAWKAAAPALFYSNDTDSLAYFNSFIFSYRSSSSLSLYFIWSTITYTVFFTIFSRIDNQHVWRQAHV